MVVYLITNKINGKKYVGQTVSSLNKRWREHCAKGFALNSAIKKYGKNNFKIEIVATASTITILNKFEELVIKKYNTTTPNGYNIRQGGDNKRHSEETKLKMSKAAMGRKVSDETRKRNSEAHKGQKAWNKGKKLSKENCEAISRSRVNKKKVRCATTGKSFESMMDADKRFNLPAGSVSKVCNGKRKSTHGLTFEFIMEVTHSVD